MINNLRNKGVDTVKVVGSVLSVLAMVLTLTIVSVNLNKIEYAHAAQYDLMDDSGKYVAPQFSLADITSGVVTITITGISRENAGGSASYSESKYCAIAAGTKPASGAEMNASCSSGIISTNNPTRTFTVNYTPTSTDIDYPIRVYELSANKTWTSDYADIIDYPVVILNLKKYYYTNQTNTNTTAYVDWQFNTSSSYFNAEDGQHTFYCINGVAANNSRCDQVQTFGSEVVQSHADGTFYGWVKGNYDATETVIPPSTSVSISEGDKFRPVFKATAPTFSPTGESASTPAALNFTAMSGQIICMTTDGTDPLMIVGLSGCASPSTSISSPFSSGITPGQSAVQTVKAVAYNSSYTQPNITGSLLASDVVSSTYDFHRNIYFNLNGGSGTTPTERVGFVGSVAPSTVTPTDFTAPTATTTYEFKGFSDGLTAVNPFTEVCSGVLYYDENGAATANTIQAPKNDSLTLFACWLPIPGSNVTGVPATASVAVLDHGVNEVTVTLTAPAQFFTPVGVISANVQYCISDQSDGSNCGAGDGAFVEWRTYGSGISFTKGSNGTSENVLYIFAKDPNSSATLPGSVAYTVNEISYKDLAVGAYSAYTTYGLIGETVHIAPSQTLTLGRTSTRWCDETTCTNFYTSDTDFVISAVGSLALRPEFAPEAPGANPDPDSVTSTPITVSFTTQEAPADAEILYSEDASDITALQSCTNSGNIETYTTPISASITTDVTYYAVTCIKGESGLKKYAIPSQLTTVEYSLNRTIDFDLNGGTGTAPDEQVLSYGDPLQDLTTDSGAYEAPTHGAYTLMGWYDVQTSVDSVNTACLGTEYADAEGISQGLPVYSSETLYACWLLTYEVTFDANGGTGTAPDSQSVPGNAAIQNLTTGGATYDAPTLAGYTLQGWYNQNTAVSPATAACNGVQYADAEGNADASKHITAATTLYACWLDQTAPDSVTGVTASIPNEWTNSVRLSIPTSTDNGGTQVDDLQYCVSTSDSITTASPGCRSSLAAGWIIESDEFTVDYTSATPDTAFTIYIYVKDLRSNVSAYTAYTNTVRTMTYEKNGGSAITTPQYFLNGSSLVDASTNTPTLAGATFETWCDFGDASFAECTSFKSDGTGYEFAPGDSFPFDNSGNQPYFYTTDSHVLYALYKFNNPDAASFDIVPATFEDLADGYIDGVTATYEYAEVASSDDCSTVSSWTAGTGEISGISGADVSYYCIRKVADVTNGILASDPIKLEVAAGTARVYDPDVQIEATTELIYGYDDVAYYTVTFDNSASNSPVTFATPTLTGSDFVVVGDCASDSTLVAAGETVSDNCEVHFLAGKNAGTYSTTVTVGWISVAGNGGVPGTSKSDSIAVTGYEQTVAQRPITIKANDVRVFQGTNINDFNELINWTITVGELVEGDSLLGSYKIDVSCVGNTDTIGVKEDCVVEDSEHMFDSEPFAGNYDITVLKGNVVIAAAFTISGDEEKLVVEPDALCYTVGNLWTYNEDELTVHLDEIGKTRVDVNTFVAGTNSAGSCLGTIVGVTFEQTATKVRNVIVESNVFAQGAISSTQGSPDFVAEPADNTLEFVHFDTQLKAVELRSNAFLQVSETGNTLNDVEFGSNIQTISIGDNAFRQYTVDGYNALQELVFADNAKTIVLGDSAFEQYNKANSVALADVTFPQGVVTLGIGDYAFYQYSDNANTALTQITFPDSVAQFKVGHGAFEQRAGDDATLVSVTFPSKLRELEIGSRAFYQHSGYYVNDMHEGNVALKTIVFPPALTKLTIGERAFQQTANSNDELVGVSFPDSLKSLRIDDYAFQQISHTGANALESVTFPINLENLYIGDNAFYQESIKGNNALESVTFPIRVQSLTINDEAFAQVVGDSNAKNSLKYFFIPSEVPPGLGAGYIALGENITRVTNSVTQVSSLIDWTWYGDGGTTTARWGSFVVGGSGVYNLVHQDGPIKLYRLYNPVSLEHFYTTDAYERDTLVQVAPDWTYEHVGWVAPNRGTPVFRLYNPILGDHLYTTDTNERDTLTREYNWIYEKIAFYSGGTIPIYRAFNPHLISGSHLYTSSINEQLDLMSFGWNNEYIKMYSMAEQCPTPDKPNPDIYYCDAIN